MHSTAPLTVVALGGNALLRRGEPATAANQLRAARDAARVLGPVSETARLVITHGNGPQVGLLALKEDAYTDGMPYPLDVLDAESGGQIGYVVELELDNAIDHQDTVAVLTRVLVDADDPAFADPTKFIGPVYDEQRAHALAAERAGSSSPTAIAGGGSFRRRRRRRSSSSARSGGSLTAASSSSASAAAGSRSSPSTVGTPVSRP
jgi:carbamate kinase